MKQMAIERLPCATVCAASWGQSSDPERQRPYPDGTQSPEARR